MAEDGRTGSPNRDGGGVRPPRRAAPQGHRITVRQLAALVEDEGLAPEAVSGRYDLRLADVYRVLTYYHDHPEELERVERERRSAIEEARERGVPTVSELRERHEE